MASFGKPIRRRTADGLVAGMLGRAREYKKPLYIERLRIFGSYLDPRIDPLGDVDVELSFGMRTRDHNTISA
jgi:predicted nucleotidyltransferase